MLKVCRVLCALLVVVAAFGGRTVHAAALGPTGGTCIVSGSVSFQPAIGVVPQTNVLTSVNVSGTCVSLGLRASGGIQLQGQPLASCDLAEGSMFGTVTTPNAGSLTVGADYIGAPATILLDTTQLGGVSQDFVGTAVLVEVATGNPVGSALTVAGCPAFGAGTFQVTGVFVYDQ